MSATPTSSPASVSGSVNVESSSQGDDDKYPLWKYAKKIEKKDRGGSVRFECKICHESFVGSYTRVKFHLLKVKAQGIKVCNKITNETLMEVKKLVQECEEKESNSRRCVPLPLSRGQSGINPCSRSEDDSQTYGDPKKRKSVDGTIKEAFDRNKRDQCDSEIARMFYTSGLSFNLAKNPSYHESYVRASKIPDYIPPSYNALRTTLLQREKHNVEHLLKYIKFSWKDKGVSLCSDGWTDNQKIPLINMMAANQQGAMFLRAINCQGEYKDKHLVANLLIDSIRDIGAQNVVQVITDNAPVCRAAGLLIEQKFPTIFWTPCVVHTLNLALRSICHPKPNEDCYLKCSWISEIAKDASCIKNFIMHHGMRLSMFNDHYKLKLLSVAETRFASTIVMLRRFKDIKEDLQQMVVSPKWDLYTDDDRAKALAVKQKILDDGFWDDLDYILIFTDPIYNMIRKSDTDEPCLHLVYEWWDTMIQNVKSAIYRKEHKQLDDVEESPFFNEVYKVLTSRWSKSSTPLHCLAHSLNPKYYSEEWLGEDSNRKAPHNDGDITRERTKCVERYFSNLEDRRRVNIEFASFTMSLNDFSGCDVMSDRYHLDPLIWWVIHGSSAPTLQSIAMKLLGQPCSASCCERNWSTYSFIHSVMRSKITPERVEDLVFVHTNLRLLSRKKPSYKHGPHKMWDIGGDTFDTMDVGNVGMLEMASLTLDEPILEAVVFDDVNDDEDDTIPSMFIEN